jgi:hemolysin activation/secretion protein
MSKQNEKIDIFKFFFPLSVLIIVSLVSISNIYAQTASQYEKSREEIELKKQLRKRIEKEEKIPQIKQKGKEALPKEKGKNIFIKEIKVIGVTIFDKKEIKKIISPYENKELSLKEIHKIADLITDLYYRNGYLTSRAYIPPQNLSNGVLEIKVLEGKMGNLKIEGNHYFNKDLFKKKFLLKKGEYFNYYLLRKSLIKINEHPDRRVRAVLVPGEKRGETDVILEVKDYLPIHIGFDYDNFGSRFIGGDRFALIFNHNNLTGNDDILSLKLQKADAYTYTFRSLNYLLPISNSWEIVFFAARARLKLGGEFKDTDVRGKSTLISFSLNKYLKDEEDFNIKLKIGFDYKHIRNYILSTESSKDEMRVMKVSLDIDKIDRMGRTIFLNEFDYGIPELWAGLDKVDSNASRVGSGGKFTKWNIFLLRLQKMPFDSLLLWENQFQISPYILTSAEQFQIGGITNNRGYPLAEKVGDQGYSSSLELSFPVYFIPKRFYVPFCKERFYDSLRMLIFYDWAHTNLRNPQTGEEKHVTLRSAGFGFKFNLPTKDLLVRLEFGWPLDQTPSDEKHLHTWIEVSKIF